MRSTLGSVSCSFACVFSLFCAAFSERCSLDQPSSLTPAPADRNAALLYWQYRQEAMESQLLYVIGIDGQDEKGWTPNAEETKSLVENKAVIEKLLRATKLDLCDWGTEYELGLDVTLHHLALGRGAARLLRADARRLIAAGDGDAAAERIAAMFRLAKHVSEPHATTVSTMVGGAMVEFAMTEIDNLVAHEALTVRGRESLRPCVDQLLGPDPIDIVAALRFERDWVGQALYQELLPRMMASAKQGTLQPPEANNDPQRIETGTRQGTTLAAQRARPAFDKAIACWDDPDAVPKLTAIWQRAQDGDFGPGTLILPKLHERKQTELDVVERAKGIREKLDAAPGSR